MAFVSAPFADVQYSCVVGKKKLSKGDMAKATVKLINRGLGTLLSMYYFSETDHIFI